MSQTCTICRSKRKAKIEAAILQRVPIRRIAAQFRLAEASIQRHKAHMKTAIAKAREEAELKSGKSAFAQFMDMWDEAVKEYRLAKTPMARAIWFREKRALFEMAAKLGLQAQAEKSVYRGCHPAIIELIRDYLSEMVPYDAQ